MRRLLLPLPTTNSVLSQTVGVVRDVAAGSCWHAAGIPTLTPVTLSVNRCPRAVRPVKDSWPDGAAAAAGVALPGPVCTDSGNGPPASLPGPALTSCGRDEP
jgi:hypothetical protein